MFKYKKFQFGWVIVIIFITVIVLMTLSYLKQWGTNPLDKGGYIFLMILFGSFFLIFYGMTIIVTDNQILIRLGIGLITKKIDLSEIISVDTKKYPIYFGYGIRITPNGILYNVNGRHAVEIRLKNKKNVIQIGTNDWDNLKNVIEAGITKDKRTIPGFKV
jgi:hypothetical protein